MNLFTVVAVSIALAIAGGVALRWVQQNQPLRDSYVLHFSVCDTRSDGTFQCSACFAGKREPLCPEDATIMMMRAK